MMYKATIASLFIYALVNCSQLDIVSVPKNIIVLVPKEILHKILKIDILNEKMYEWTEYTRCHEMINDQSFGKFFIEEEREKGYYFSALKTATLFSMVNKGFYLQLALHIEPYKNWLSIALKNDIYENLKVGKQLTLTGSCDMYAMLKSGGNLEYYLNNKAYYEINFSCFSFNLCRYQRVCTNIPGNDPTVGCVRSRCNGLFKNSRNRNRESIQPDNYHSHSR